MVNFEKEEFLSTSGLGFLDGVGDDTKEDKLPFRLDSMPLTLPSSDLKETEEIDSWRLSCCSLSLVIEIDLLINPPLSVVILSFSLTQEFCVITVKVAVDRFPVVPSQLLSWSGTNEFLGSKILSISAELVLCGVLWYVSSTLAFISHLCVSCSLTSSLNLLSLKEAAPCSES